MTTGYGADLAYIHDVGHGDFARRAAPALLKMFRAAGITRGLVVDLGCGSGIWARELTDAGHDVLGIDQSPEMLRIARRRAPKASFVRGSFLDAKLPECAAVTALGEVFSYLFDESNDAGSLSVLFRRVHRALRPGGLFVFDVATPGRGGGRGKRQRHVQGDDWTVLLETEETKTGPVPVFRRHETGTGPVFLGGVLTRRIVSFRKLGRLYRRDEEVHRLRLYRPRDVAAALRRAGFNVRVLRCYGEITFPAGWAAFAARKPAENPLGARRRTR